MARDILSEYGPDTPKHEASRAECGGVEMKDVKDIPYSPPKGPIGIGNRGPGLGGTNHGNAVDQGKH